MKAPIFLSLLFACGLACAAEKDAEKKTPTDELLEVMRFEEFAVETAVTTFDASIAQLKASGVPAAALPEIREEARKMFARIFGSPELKKKTAELYNQRFTPAEITELIKFYHTPLGQKALAATPAINAATTTMSMEAFKAESAAFQKKVTEIVAKHKKAAEEKGKDAEGKDAKGE